MARGSIRFPASATAARKAEQYSALAERRSPVSVVPFVDRKRAWRVDPRSIAQRKLIVGARSERYEMPIAGEGLTIPVQPIYVRPAIRHLGRWPDAPLPAAIAVARMAPATLLRLFRWAKRAFPDASDQACALALACIVFYLLVVVAPQLPRLFTEPPIR